VSVLSAATAPSAATLVQRLLLVLLFLALATGAWWLAHRRDGRFAAVDRTSSAPPPRLTAADLGRPLGRERTFVQLSSATCSSCPQVRRVLREVAAERRGVEHAELMVEDNVLLFERLGVRRTPTVLLLDEDGAVLSRESGPLRADQARAALDLSHDPLPEERR
jgi:hypothetical protein